MENSDWLKIKEIFYQTLDLPKNEREAFLAGQTDFVRSEVVGLIASHENAESFIAQPAVVEFGLNSKSFIGRAIGSYKLVELIGTGGMGSVYLAQRQGFEQKVAVKLIKRGMDSEAILNRFLLERQILSRLNHPNIARLLDGGTTDDDLPYFVMEYVEGLPLLEFCDHHHYGVKKRLEIFRKVCLAISYAHQNLIVHRDLKPGNVLVTNDGTPKLLDFGIAKLLETDLEDTATHARILTPEYASPEQLNGLPATTSADVYSLGVVLYELLSGARPFRSQSKNYHEIARMVLTQEPLRPSAISEHNESDGKTALNRESETELGKKQTISAFKEQFLKSLRGDIDNIILKALRKEPERRYHSVREFSEDIRRHLEGLPVTATADSIMYRFSKFVRRHRTGALLTSFIALFLVASSGITLRQYFVAQNERAKAEYRLKQMREVASSLINETSESLNNLPDGQEVRQSIIEKSAALLDSLSAGETDDAEFMSELGDAYQQLGHALNWQIRDSERALASLLKARQLHEKIVEMEPENLRFRRKLSLTLGALSEFYQLQGNTEEAIEVNESADKTALKLTELQPDNASLYFDRSNINALLSELYSGLNRAAESADKLRRAVDLVDRAIGLQQAIENTPDNLSKLAFFLMQKGTLVEKTGNKEDALLIYSTAVQTADRSFVSDSSQRLAFNHSIRSRRMMADIYRSRGDWGKSLELYEFCLNRLELNADNKNLDLKTIQNAIAIYTMRKGVALDKLGKKQEGRQTVGKGLALYLTQLRRFENQASDIIYAPDSLSVAVDYYVENGQKRISADLLQIEYLDRLALIIEKAPNDSGMIVRYADGLMQKGDLLSGQKNGFSETNQSYLREALENYELALRKINSISTDAAGTKWRSEELHKRISQLRERIK